MVKFQVEFYIMWRIEARQVHVHLGNLVLPSDNSSKTLLLSFETRCQLSVLGQPTTISLKILPKKKKNISFSFSSSSRLTTPSLSTTSSPTFVVVFKVDETHSIICLILLLIFLLKKENNLRLLPFRLLSSQASRFVRARFVFVFFCFCDPKSHIIVNHPIKRFTTSE